MMTNTQTMVLREGKSDIRQGAIREFHEVLNIIFDDLTKTTLIEKHTSIKSLAETSDRPRHVEEITDFVSANTGICLMKAVLQRDDYNLRFILEDHQDVGNMDHYLMRLKNIYFKFNNLNHLSSILTKQKKNTYSTGDNIYKIILDINFNGYK